MKVCSELYGPSWAQIVTAEGRTDTLEFKLQSLGKPSDGRRCETVIEIDGPLRDPLDETFKKRKP